jgi:dihydroneopterin aldolase
MNNPSVVHIDPLHSRDADRIHVFMHDCKVALHIGIGPEERITPQTVIVNIDCEAALPHRYHNLIETRFDHVIDYARLVEYTTVELPKLGPVALLELIAEKLITFCFEDRRIDKVRVRLEKPEIFSGKALVGIEICRTRANIPT